MDADVRTVVSAAGRATTSGAFDELRDWSVERWRAALVGLPAQSGTYEGQFEVSWDESIEALRCWVSGAGGREGAGAEVYGFVGVLLLTLCALRHSERQRSLVDEKERAARPGVCSHCDDVCRPLLEHPAVRTALRDLYAPDATLPAQMRAEWDGVDPEALLFYRHGTTSFILTGRRRLTSDEPACVVKCIILPFLSVPAIRKATRQYAERYRLPTEPVGNLVRIWASFDSWILMDYADGPTLAERLDELVARRPTASALFPRATIGDDGTPSSTTLRFELLDDLGPKLFHALGNLERCGLVHGDLSPSNIIVTLDPDSGQETFTLVDLGENYLYQRQVDGQPDEESRYVAPEVRAERSGGAAGGSHPSADLYSLGQLLVLLGAGHVRRDGTVPALFYADAPLLARFVEDLVDADPDRRLLVFGTGQEVPVELFAALGRYFRAELEVTRAAQRERLVPNRGSSLADVAMVFEPLSGSLGRLWRFRAARRAQGLYADPLRSMRARWLLGWSVVSVVCTSVAVALLAAWTRGPVGALLTGLVEAVDPPARTDLLALVDSVFGPPEAGLPFLHRLRAPGYESPPPGEALALGVMALSSLLVGLKYYQSLFAQMTPLVTGIGAGAASARALLAEVLMRVWTVANAVLVVSVLVVNPAWWSVGVALGVVGVLLTNACTGWFGRRTLADARTRGLSTVPDVVTGIRVLSSWLAGSATYAALLAAVCVLLLLDVAHDDVVYIVAITFGNLVQLYAVKCGMEGPDIRAGLMQACLAAERVKLAGR